MKVSVFRVETPRGGCGPYTREFEAELSEMFEAHRVGGHPGPQGDELLKGILPKEHCGFATLEQLHKWFDGFHEALHQAGFVIAKYVVPVHLVRYGKTQLVFRRGDMFPVESEPVMQ